MINFIGNKFHQRLFAILAALTLVGCKETIDARQLENINGLYYKLNEHDPFTGTVINNLKVGDYTSYYTSNCTIEFKNGQMDGAFICHSLKDEIKVAEMGYKSNLKHGTQRGWDKQNGALKWKIEWNNGKHHGVEEKYNSSNGKLVEEIHWDNDQKVGTERIWNVNGDVLLEDLYWSEGKKTGYSIYRDYEHNFKDGKLDGINRRFELIGSLSEYGDLEADVKKIGAGSSAYILLPHYVSLEETYQDGQLISSVRKFKDKEQELEFNRIEQEKKEQIEEDNRLQEMYKAQTLQKMYKAQTLQ